MNAEDKKSQEANEKKKEKTFFSISSFNFPQKRKMRKTSQKNET